MMEVMIFTVKVGELTVSPTLAQRLWSAFVEAPSPVGRHYDKQRQTT
jgi:hypothetical protein